MLFDGGAYCEYRQLGALQKYPPYHAWFLGSRVQNNPGMRIPPGLGNGRKKRISFERIPWVQIILSQGRLILTFFCLTFTFQTWHDRYERSSADISFLFLATMSQHLVRIQLPDSKGENYRHGQKIIFRYLRERHPERSEESLGKWGWRQWKRDNQKDNPDGGSSG